jgi:hypothetical protein
MLTASAATNYPATKSYPRLRIVYANAPVKKPQPLRIKLEIVAQGETPVALSQKQFTVSFSPYPYVNVTPTFETNAAPVFTVTPEKPVTLTFTVPTDRLKTGNQRFDVRTNSGRRRQFDYQWLGQTYSDHYEIDVK